MTKRAKINQRDVKAAIKGVIGAGAKVRQMRFTDREVILNLASSPPDPEDQLAAERAEWDRLVADFEPVKRGKQGN
jgi:hypothetical protein